MGELHGASSPPSRLHQNSTPGWSAEKVNSARLFSVWTSGPEWMVVIGATVCPISHSYSTHCCSQVPPGARARTANRCGPCSSPLYVLPETQGSSTAPSSQQRKVEPGTSETKVKVALVLPVISAGPLVMIETGGSSTVHS